MNPLPTNCTFISSYKENITVPYCNVVAVVSVVVVVGLVGLVTVANVVNVVVVVAEVAVATEANIVSVVVVVGVVAVVIVVCVFGVGKKCKNEFDYLSDEMPYIKQLRLPLNVQTDSIR